MNDKPKKPADPLDIARRTHVAAFNPPHAVGGVSDSDTLRSAALEAFQGARFADFRRWVNEQFPKWEDDDSAQHLVGQAFKYEGDLDLAEHHLDIALEMRKERTARTHTVLAEVAVDRGDRPAAWRHLNDALLLIQGAKANYIYLNRLALASLMKDESRCELVYNEMEAQYPTWHLDQQLVRWLLDDGELFFLRETSLWQKMRQLMASED